MKYIIPILMNWSDRDVVGMFKHNDGRAMSPREAKAALLEELAQGHWVIPIGDCDAFDYKTGCPGHPVDEKGAPMPERST